MDPPNHARNPVLTSFGRAEEKLIRALARKPRNDPKKERPLRRASMYRVGVSRCGGEGRRFLACHAFIRSGYQGWRPPLWTRWGPGLSFNPDWGRNPTDARPVPCSALESGTLQSTPHARRCLDPSGASRKVQSPFERLCGPIGGFHSRLRATPHASVGQTPAAPACACAATSWRRQTRQESARWFVSYSGQSLHCILVTPDISRLISKYSGRDSRESHIVR